MKTQKPAIRSLVKTGYAITLSLSLLSIPLSYSAKVTSHGIPAIEKKVVRTEDTPIDVYPTTFTLPTKLSEEYYKAFTSQEEWKEFVKLLLLEHVRNRQEIQPKLEAIDMDFDNYNYVFISQMKPAIRHDTIFKGISASIHTRHYANTKAQTYVRVNLQARKFILNSHATRYDYDYMVEIVQIPKHHYPLLLTRSYKFKAGNF